MKRILTLVCLTALLICCDFGPRESSAKHYPTTKIANAYYRDVNITLYEYNGIEYRVFHQGEGGLFVLNHTKEQMEMELIQKQIDEIDKEEI